MKTCLVVDDSGVARKVARRILEDFSFSVSEAVDGQKALEECLRAMPDAIVLDWAMPITDGLEFLAKLRATPGGDAPKVIFCTAKNDLDHIAKALSLGADEYIMKPFDSEILREKLVEVGLLEESVP
ncbi:response regulator [Aquabacter sp. L1I39]|uniref:response regulator n=1 Tax=Aquabacter sp. L1I39 TaxID=2820278 RepID=UPI001ADAD002|nr:response regulator [Aquabacter sp. L1I39]QTL04296.1 response regulator [Aquabacter sp. L1I39]